MTEPESVVRLEKVSKAYTDGQTFYALNEIDVVVNRGERVAIHLSAGRGAKRGRSRGRGSEGRGQRVEIHVEVGAHTEDQILDLVSTRPTLDQRARHLPALDEHVVGPLDGRARSRFTHGIRQRNQFKSEKIVSTLDFSKLDAFVRKFPTRARVPLPNVLTGMNVVWEESNGDGSYSYTPSNVKSGINEKAARDEFIRRALEA